LADRRHDLTEEQAAEQGLVARARSGDRSAFREIVERYEGLVAATVIGMMGPGPEAEDVGQKTFIRFYTALDQYRGEGGLAPYLTRIAVNLSLNAIEDGKRRRRRFTSRDAGDELSLESSAGPAGETLPFDEREIVHRAIDALSPEHRSVVVLRLINGYSTKETAEMLGIPVGTVLSRLNRAQQILRDLLGPYLQDEP
jgi:RNA polymerase sigma-70 factor (ECF subfamily)